MVTFPPFCVEVVGTVNPKKDRKSNKVSKSSSASDSPSSAVSEEGPEDGGCTDGVSPCCCSPRSNNTSPVPGACSAFRSAGSSACDFVFLFAHQNRFCHAPRSSVSNRKGNIRVNTRIQLSASFAGANSVSGKAGWCRNANKREVSASSNVSRFSGAESRTRRISVGEINEKISAAVSGRDQNWLLVLSRGVKMGAWCLNPVCFSCRNAALFK